MTEEGSLEKVMKERIEPMLEDAMQKYLGVKIGQLERDIANTLESTPLLAFHIPTNLPFKEAKKTFKKQFFTRAIHVCGGNISKVAKLVGQDRRSLHRHINALGIGVKGIKRIVYHPDTLRRSAVDALIRHSLDNYRTILREERIQQFYEHTPQLSENIAKLLPERELRWKEAETHFEKEYLTTILKEMRWDLPVIARRIGLRYETLLRKIKKLGLRKTI